MELDGNVTKNPSVKRMMCQTHSNGRDDNNRNTNNKNHIDDNNNRRSDDNKNSCIENNKTNRNNDNKNDNDFNVDCGWQKLCTELGNPWKSGVLSRFQHLMGDLGPYTLCDSIEALKCLELEPFWNLFAIWMFQRDMETLGPEFFDPIQILGALEGCYEQYGKVWESGEHGLEPVSWEVMCSEKYARFQLGKDYERLKHKW